MVRREEQPWQSRATMLPGRPQSVHRGEGPGSSFEWAVSVAASVGVHLAEEGLSLRLVTDSGEHPEVTSAPGAAAGGELLEALAVIVQTRTATLVPGIAAVRGSGGRDSEGLVVAIFGVLTAEEARIVATARRGTAVALAVIVDPSGSGMSSAAVAFLRGSGWRVLQLASLTDLPAAWAGVHQGVLTE